MTSIHREIKHVGFSLKVTISSGATDLFSRFQVRWCCRKLFSFVSLLMFFVLYLDRTFYLCPSGFVNKIFVFLSFLACLTSWLNVRNIFNHNGGLHFFMIIPDNVHSMVIHDRILQTYKHFVERNVNTG